LVVENETRGMSQSEDLIAIDDYFHRIERKTSQATNDFNSWVAWFTSLGWYDKNFTQATYDEARNRKHQFDLDNATSEDERAQVLEVQKTGLSTEQMEGNVDRRTSSGNYFIQKPPWVPTWIWYAGGGFIALVTGITVVVAGKAVAEAVAKKHL
jgi:hypothetical protein